MTKQKIIVALSSDFFTAYAKLPRNIQNKTTEFINKFRNNPKSAGINFEKIQNAIDNKIWSVRIDDTYRGIVVHQEEDGVYLLLWVDHHDQAYNWAKNKKCEINKSTGSVQVFDIQTEMNTAENKQTNLFSEISDEILLKIGVPNEQLSFIKSINSLSAFYDKKNTIPMDAYESLEWIANGFSIDDVLSLYSENTSTCSQSLEEALKTDRSQNSFYVVEGEEDLRMMMSEPLEKWRIFLHPTQRRLIDHDYSGPCRVLGSAGTGKTVIAMHRAKWLAVKLEKNERILFTTYSTNLAHDIKNNLRKICNPEDMRKIDIINLDEWVSNFLRENDITYRIIYGDDIENLWNEAISLSGESLDLPVSFYIDEWTKVVAPQEAFTQEDYIKATRVGCGIRLNRKMKLQIWNIFDEYQILMKERHVRDIDTAMYDCRILLKQSHFKKYSSVIVDEGQDFGSNAYKLLRHIVNDEHKNDMFIVGDTHQRIYKRKVVLSNCGINIRGRSSNLKINYRTTEETRKYAFAILKDISFDDLDNEFLSEDKSQSLTHGDFPVVCCFQSVNKECEYIVNEIKKLNNNGIRLENICLVARKKNLIDDYKKELLKNGINVYEIKRNTYEDRSFEGIRIATMHRVKGLEFQFIFIVSANDRIIPLPSAINTDDPIARNENMTSEKCLLYVAMTRSQKMTYITGYGKMSEFLPKV